MSDNDAADVTEETRPIGRRLGRVLLGTGLVAVGVPMLVLPGPGLVSIAAGVSLIGSEVPAVKARVDRLTDRVRS